MEGPSADDPDPEAVVPKSSAKTVQQRLRGHANRERKNKVAADVSAMVETIYYRMVSTTAIYHQVLVFPWFSAREILYLHACRRVYTLGYYI